MKNTFLAAAMATALTLPVAAEQIAFDGAWREQGFLRLFSNEFIPRGASLDVISDGTVSLFWRPVPENARAATGASWAWSVTQGVPPTDLVRKGGDDRNLAIYFVFTDPETAKALDPTRAAKLLRDPATKALVYVWGGDKGRGTVQVSPYHSGLRTLIRRPAGTGSHTEAVDLARDYVANFGDGPRVLVGLGITADSDDTDTAIRATIGNLALN